MPYASVKELDAIALQATPLAIDWRAVAEFRLGRLVEAEHDVVLMRERIERLLAEHGEWLAAGEAQFESRWAVREETLLRLHQAELAGLQRHEEHVRQPEELACLRLALAESELAARLAQEKHAELLASTSWRITASLRVAMIALRAKRASIRRVLLLLLRVPGLRPLARQLLRPFPKLRSRLVMMIVTGV